MEQRMRSLRICGFIQASLLWVFGFGAQLLPAQQRIGDNNQILWMPLTASVKVKGPVSLHLEYQWRRDAWGTAPQQSLLRAGITYRITPNLSAQAGYGLIHTYAYGDYPIASMGTFPENRLYQQLQWQAVYPKGTETIQRLRLEQRWLKPNPAAPWSYLNRLRYLTRVHQTLGAPEKSNVYLIAWDELFIGFGKQLNLNIFDQNRAFIGVGRKMNAHWNLEAGALSQILQQPRAVNNKAVIQYNAGPWIGSTLRF